MRLLPFLLAESLLLGACSSAYYGTLEKFGVYKRDILVDRVQEGKEQQAEAQEQFLTTFERFKKLSGVDLGELEDMYERVENDFERCQDEADAVHERISSIETVAEDLFTEWEDEIEQISSPELRAKSRESLEETTARYEQLIAAMKRAEAKMEPVLVSFRDQILFLKHNLNARAIASLEQTVASIEDDVERLIADMQASIREADAFIGSIEG